MSIKGFVISCVSALLLVACSGNVRKTNILVDLNSTFSSPLYVLPLPALDAIVDSAQQVNGQYRLSSADWKPGLYRFSLDSVNFLDVVIHDTRPLMICARRNHFSEATTNDPEARLLWQVENFQHHLDSLHADSLYTSLRSKADAFRILADTSIVMLPVLNLSFNGRHIYNIISDYNIFEQASRHLASSYPDNADISLLASLVQKARLTARFVNRYAKGKDAPSFSIDLRNGSSLSSDFFNGGQYVFHFTTDTCRTSQNQWQSAALNRFNGYRVVGSIPRNFSHIGNLNVFEGQVDSGTASELAPFQPITMFVNANGKITDISYNTH